MMCRTIFAVFPSPELSGDRVGVIREKIWCMVTNMTKRSPFRAPEDYKYVSIGIDLSEIPDSPDHIASGIVRPVARDPFPEGYR